VSDLPSTSVVVAARNAERVIGECVASLLELDYPAQRLELLVVDNGSRDGTVRQVRRHGDRVQVMSEARRGAAAARNAGVRVAAGEVVAFTDADCTVDRQWLRRLAAALDDPQVGIAGGTILARRPAGDVELFGETIHDHRRAIEVFQPPYAITMSWASPRRVLRELGGFDERFRRCQDVDLSYRVVQSGYRLAFVAGAVVHHRNEATLGGLFREGFVHGFHGVRARKRHAEFLRSYGYAPAGLRGHAAEWARVGRADSRCAAAFASGKQVGKLAGSLRFGYPGL
jgi:cellulose synthase/poly-beta-1,6-N-acetylglucosamine synthase-like glycosyltransferase